MRYTQKSKHSEITMNPIALNLANLTAATPDPATAPAAADKTKAGCDQVCREFESVLCTTMLKNSIKAAAASNLGGEDGEEKDAGGDMFGDFAYEQMAYQLGQQGIFGLSEVFSERLRESVEKRK